MQRSLIHVILAGFLITSTGCAMMPGSGKSSAKKESASESLSARMDDDSDPGLTPSRLRRSRNAIGQEDGFHWDHMQSSEARRIEQSLGLE